jgi:aryl-alcohol dehydrogenase-like predicted oxidoreductase
MAIEHRRLGKHGVLVSNICLGTMNFGWHTTEEESFKIMDRAVELGINFFDTADIYGWGGEQGDTEEILGRWFAQGGGRRDAVVLATKVFNPVKRKANQQLGKPPAAVALAWLLHNPIVTAPIIGPRTIEQLESTLHATEIRLDKATLEKLDEIFPGPGGEAPEAYAW